MPDLTYEDQNGLTAGEIRETLLPALRGTFDMEVPGEGLRDGFLELKTPFHYVAGDHIPMGLEVRDGQWCVSDHGDTLLRHQDIYSLDYIRGFVQGMARQHGADLVDDAVLMRWPHQEGPVATVRKFAALLLDIEAKSNERAHG